MVPTKELVLAMREDWIRNENVPSAGLEETWRVIGNAFAQAVEENRSLFSQHSTKIRAIPAATGAGKSRMAIITAAKMAELPREKHFGILIVQQTVAEVTKTTESINELAERFAPAEASGHSPQAVAYHYGVREEIPPETLCEWPTVCITHEAFRRAFDSTKRTENSPTWEDFSCFNGNGGPGGAGKRALVVIDEELSLNSESSVTGNDLARVIYLVEEDLAEEFPFELGYMKTLHERLVRLKGIAAANRDTASFVIMLQPIKGAQGFHDFRKLREALRAKSFYSRLGHKDSQEEQKKHEEIDAIVQGVRAITQSHLWAARIGEEVALMSSHSMLPKRIGSIVALDATCREDIRNELNPAVEILEVPANVRRYDNVELFIARGPAGREALVKKDAQAAMTRLMSWADGYFTKENSVFMIVHLGARPQLELIQPENFNRSIGHYGEIAGINSRRDDDACVVLGLNYPPQYWAKQQTLAHLGGQPQAWHDSESERAWGTHQDIVSDVYNGFILSHLIQSISRIRIRKTIDELGNCAPAKVFCLLPSGPRGDFLLEGLKDAFPGIVEKGWDYDGKPKRKVKRTRQEEALIFYLAHLPKGRTPTRKPKGELGIPSPTWKRYMERILGGKQDDPLVQAMKKAEVSLQLGPKGTRGKSFFVRLQ